MDETEVPRPATATLITGGTEHVAPAAVYSRRQVIELLDYLNMALPWGCRLNRAWMHGMVANFEGEVLKRG